MAWPFPRAVWSWITTLVVGVFVMGAGRGHLLPAQIVGEDSRVAFASVSTTSTEAGSLGFSTYLGGSKYDSIRDVTTDGQGNIYVTGGTTSPDFPITKGAYQTKHNPGSPDNSRIAPFDVFVTKLDPSGKLLWSTFIGGPNYDRAYAIEVDKQGYVYVAGRAGRGFPVTTEAFQTTFMGGQGAAFYGPQDGFVLKLTPDGSQLVWSSYFGASSDPSIVRDIAIDQNGNVYLASGYKSGGTYPRAVAKAFVNTPRGGDDAVMAKIQHDGAKVLWARYVGGSGTEDGNGSVRVNGAENPHLLFTTQSSGIATAGAWDTTYGGNEDMFVAKFDPLTGALIWGTYIGGSKNESTETHEFAGFDAQGNVYVTGPTKSIDFPTTPGAYSRTFSSAEADSNEIFVVKISAEGSKLLAGTYIGGNGWDRSEGSAVDADGNVYLTGVTSSSNFPITPGAAQTILRGENDAFVLKLPPDLSQLLYSSYFGGSSKDYGRGAAVDSKGNFYLGGETNSADWPTHAAFQKAYGGNGDAIVAKFRLTDYPHKRNSP
jgi:Beta-propeller repeat